MFLLFQDSPGPVYSSSPAFLSKARHKTTHSGWLHCSVLSRTPSKCQDIHKLFAHRVVQKERNLMIPEALLCMQAGDIGLACPSPFLLPLAFFSISFSVLLNLSTNLSVWGSQTWGGIGGGLYCGVVCHTYLWDMILPLERVVLCSSLQHRDQSTIKPFYESIALGMIECGSWLMYPKNPTNFIE